MSEFGGGGVERERRFLFLRKETSSPGNNQKIDNSFKGRDNSSWKTFCDQTVSLVDLMEEDEEKEGGNVIQDKQNSQFPIVIIKQKQQKRSKKVTKRLEF